MNTIRIELKKPLASRASAIAESEGMTLEELVDYAVRRFVGDYEFAEEPEEEENYEDSEDELEEDGEDEEEEIGDEDEPIEDDEEEE